MSFTRIKGFEGKIYQPDRDRGEKKHPCDDCFSCQWCSDERCRTCLKNKCFTCREAKGNYNSEENH